MTLLRRLFPSARGTGFMAVKVVSLGLLSIYSFEIIYVLVRILPLGFYPWMVLLTSVGAYVLAVDLGFSNYVYAIVRRDFLLGEDAGSEAIVAESACIYLLVAIVASAIAAAVIFWVVPTGLRLALTVYFVTIVLPLPWMLIRRAAAAVDLFLEIETIECVRRAVVCLLAAAMLGGFGLTAFSLASLATWVAAMAGAWFILRRAGFHLRPASLASLVAFLKSNAEGIWKSGGFGALEFVIYNFPYVAIPLIYHGPQDLVAFDLFVKVSRFGGAAYSIPAEVFTPPQTRAHYRADVEGVARYQRLTWLVGLAPLALASLFLLFLGGPLFDRLLANTHAVDPLVRVAMVAMLACLLLQSSSGGFLLSVGRYDEISRVAILSVTLMACLVLATILIGLSFPIFLMLYVGVYLFHAVLFQSVFSQVAGRTGHAAAPPLPA